MRIQEKAHYTRLIQCGCGRISLVFFDDNDEMFASCEYDPGQWLGICKELIEKNRELVDNGFEPPHEHPLSS